MLQTRQSMLTLWDIPKHLWKMKNLDKQYWSRKRKHSIFLIATAYFNINWSRSMRMIKNVQEVKTREREKFISLPYES